MSTRDLARQHLVRRLEQYVQQTGPIPGISTAESRSAFVEQIIDSERRINFVRTIRARHINPARSAPSNLLFDPIRAALLRATSGEIDEACWLIFLSIHCGKHLIDGWTLVREIYAGTGPGSEWTWASVSSNVNGFRQWLNDRNIQWQLTGTRPRFGNHRKYETLDEASPRGTGAVVESYVGWVRSANTHATLFQAAINAAGGDRARAFDNLYSSMSAVMRFGRLAKFDYLCMLGKCGLADIFPGHPYLKEATGPREGARRLFGLNDAHNRQAAVALANTLGVGMQSIEDAMCNWDKSPDIYKRFRG